MDTDLLRHLPAVFRLREAIAGDLTPYQLRAAYDGGLVRRPARGVYRQVGTLVPADPWDMVRAEHLQRCAEALARFPGHVASHQSAAALHDLTIVLHPAAEVHLTAVDGAPRSRHHPGVCLHHADSVINHTVRAHGLRATTITRTIADVLRTSRLPHSVGLLDAAARSGVAKPDSVRREVDGQVRWRGRPRALAALALHDPRRESWLESYSFVELHEHGIPLPLAQVEVLDAGFHLVGRVDGLIEETGTFLEADGAAKYRLLASELGVSQEESLDRTVAAQQRRHDRLLGLGLTGARWTTQEIMGAPELVARRVDAAMTLGDPSRFTGWLRYDGRVVRLGEAGPR